MTLLTPAEVRAAYATSATDAALLAEIAAAEAAIDGVAGPLGEQREEHIGGTSVIILNRRAASIRSIREYLADADLTTADWRLDSDRRSLWRRATGYTAGWAVGPVLVAYQPVDDVMVRRSVALKLIQHNLATVPGVLGFTEGNFSIQFPNGETWASTHDEILGTSNQPWSFG